MSSICAADCRCTKYLDALGIDTSHVAVVARASARSGESLREAIESHGCGGSRTVFTSTEVLTVEMNEEHAECPLHAFAPGVNLTEALERIEGRDHSETGLAQLVAYKPLTPDSGFEIELRHRDGTLVAVAAAFDGATVVADDEHLLRWLELSFDDGRTSVHGIPSLTLLGSLNACGAISDDLLECSLEAEEEHHGSRDVAPWILERKLERARTELNRFVRRRAEAEVA
ncbi:MAG TPA: hypothetical protein VIR30_02980 [Nocardioides sp.]